MSDEISLLPEGMRKKEEEFRKAESAKPEPAPEFRFSVPPEQGEDVEIIEIDEGEVDQVLASEPMLTRALFRVSTFIDDLKRKVFEPHAAEPPPKLPPQFFKAPPPRPAPAPFVPPPSLAKIAPAPFPAQAKPVEGPKPKPRIVPAESAPRRVRVIRRVRKPLHVSFVSEEELRILHVDIPRRKFTFAVLFSVFAVAIIGGAYALNELSIRADSDLSTVNAQLAAVSQNISEKQKAWSAFTDLEPRLKALTGLLDRHVSPTGLLLRIEQNTLPTVSYDSFSYSSDQHVLLGVTADSYESAARQIVAFQRSGFVKSVSASGYAAHYESDSSVLPSAVQFQLTLTLSDDATKPQTAGIARAP